MQKLITLGILFLFIGIILLFIGSFLTSVKDTKSNVKSAGIIFIGPFPIGWASDKTMFYTLIILIIILIAVWLIFFRRF